MAEVSGGQLIARQLVADGIDTMFTVYAGPMTSVLPACVREGIRVIGCRHEEQAAFMAQAWGYVTKKPGVVVVGSGPAMTNTITSLYNAQENGWPLVVMGGSSGGSRRSLKSRGFGEFQEANQMVFAAPACKWSVQVDHTERIPEHVHLGLGKAVSGRPGAVYIDFPGLLISESVPEDAAPIRASQPATYRSFPDPAGVEAIARMLSEAQRPLVLVGKGAAWADAAEPLRRLVDLGIPFVPSPMGRGTVPDDHPMCAGAARSFALGNADAVLMVGGRFNWIFQFGRPPSYAADARFAIIDIVAEEAYSGASVETALVADCAVAVGQLCDALAGRRLAAATSGWAGAVAAEASKNKAVIEERIPWDAVPINPYRLLRDVRDCLDRDATVVVDGETTLSIGRIVLPSYLPRHRLNSGTTACMGTGVPYAIAAKLARPNQQVVAVLGDYAFGASGMDIETAARVGAAVTFVIVNNQGIVGRISQRDAFRPEDPLVSGLLPARYEKMAEMVGGHAEHVDQPDEIVPAVRRALASNALSIVNVDVDPYVGAGRGGYM